MKTLLRADLAMIFRGKFFWISVAVSLAVECFGLALGFVYPLFDRRSGTRDMIGFFGNAVVFLFLIFAAARHFCGGMKNGAKIAAGHTRKQIYCSLTVSGLCALAVRYLLWLLFAFLYTGLVRLVFPGGYGDANTAMPTFDGIAAELWYAAPGLLVFLAMCVMFCALTKKKAVALILTGAVLHFSLLGALLLPYLAEISAELRELYEADESGFDEEEDTSFYSEYDVDPDVVAKIEKQSQRLAGISDGTRNAMLVAAKLLPIRARMEYKEYADERYPARGPEPEHPDPPPKQI
ncbi:MAG: hypothetical protein IJL26_00170, partial [Clostridia bacterium]|nr:hypothetical protein [Clostridia bacterium]